MSRKLTLQQALRDNKSRHVLGLSGGKDSAALAIYIKSKYPSIHKKMEYFFSDTGSELQEVYDFLDKLEAYLGKEINKLSSGKGFEHWLKLHNDYLPSPKQRWCTRTMKIEPFERYVGDDPVISYIGIRADEFREGYISQKPTIIASFPFIDDGLVKEDIFQLLEDSVGIPEYYKWRSRSGCYFCFFQRRDEWLGLKRNHPDLFEKAKEIEKNAGKGYTWVQGMTLDEVVAKAEEKENTQSAKTSLSKARWQQILLEDDDHSEQSCLICHL